MLDQLVFEEKKTLQIDSLKMDIEGSEREALLDTREVIFKFKPKLPISSYHLKDRFAVLPNVIKNINPNYNKILMKIYCRNACLELSHK